MKIQFEGKSAIVTGATSGIGEATAAGLAEAGCNVTITGRQEDKLLALEKTLKKSNVGVVVIPGDITDKRTRQALLDQTLSAFGQVDILINAAGIIAMDRSDNFDTKLYDRLMDVNVRSLIELIALVVPELKKTRGNIVNVSSVAGLRAFPGIYSYCVSKAAVDQVTRCAAMELAESGVRVNAVNPGVVETKLHLNTGMSLETYQKFLEHSKSTHPIGRVGQSEEVADLILFLASEKSGWITGTTQSIDGGRAQTCAR